MWQKIIKELLNSGLTQAEIAEYSGCSQTVISFLYSGKRRNVRFKTGSAILLLHEERVIKSKIIGNKC